MTIDVDNLRVYIRNHRGETDDPCDEELLFETLNDLIRLVMKRQYQYDQNKREDLEGIALLKCIELLHSDHIDPTRNLTNILYTGIRNSVGNYLKSEQRKKSKFPEIVDRHADGVLNGGHDASFSDSDYLTEVNRLYQELEEYNLPMGDCPRNVEELSVRDVTPVKRSILLTAAYKVLIK